jgi:hypothetical protein
MDPLPWILGLGAAALFGLALLHLLLSLLLIVPTWRICRRAGYSGWLSMFHLLPVLGMFIIMAVLAFGTWPAGEAKREPG